MKKFEFFILCFFTVIIGGNISLLAKTKDIRHRTKIERPYKDRDNYLSKGLNSSLFNLNDPVGDFSPDLFLETEKRAREEFLSMQKEIDLQAKALKEEATERFILMLNKAEEEAFLRKKEEEAEALRKKREEEEEALYRQREAEEEALRRKREQEEEELRQKRVAEEERLRLELEAEEEALRQKREAEEEILRARQEEREKIVLQQLSSSEKILPVNFLSASRSSKIKVNPEWKEKTAEEFRENMTFMKKIILDGETESEARDFMDRFSRQRDWFDSALNKTMYVSDENYKELVKRSTRLKNVVQAQEMANKILESISQDRSFTDDEIKKIKLAILYDINVHVNRPSSSCSSSSIPRSDLKDIVDLAIKETISSSIDKSPNLIAVKRDLSSSKISDENTSNIIPLSTSPLLGKELDLLSREIMSLKQALEREIEKRRKTKKKSREKDEKIIELEERLIQAQESIVDYRNQIEKQGLPISLETQKTELTNRNDQINSAKLEDLQQKLDLARKEIQLMKGKSTAELLELKQESDQRISGESDLREQLANSIRQKEKKNLELEQERNIAKKENEILTKKLSQVEKDVVAKKNEEFKKQIEPIKKQLILSEIDAKKMSNKASHFENKAKESDSKILELTQDKVRLLEEKEAVARDVELKVKNNVKEKISEIQKNSLSLEIEKNKAIRDANDLKKKVEKSNKEKKEIISKAEKEITRAMSGQVEAELSARQYKKEVSKIREKNNYLKEALANEKNAKNKIASMAKKQSSQYLNSQADVELQAYFSKKKAKNLKNRVGDLNEKYSLASKKIDDLSEKYSKESSKLAAIEEEKNRIENQAKEETVLAKKGQLEAELGMNVVMHENKKLKDQVIDLSDQYAVASEKISDLGEQYSVASRKIEDLSEQNSEASKKIKDLSKQRSIGLKKLSVLDKEKKDFEKYAKGVVSELEEDLLSEKQARKKIASMAKNQVMKSLSNQADTELKAYFSKKKVKRLKNQIGDLGDQYSIASRKVEDLSEQVSRDALKIMSLDEEKNRIENQAKEEAVLAKKGQLEAELGMNVVMHENKKLKDQVIDLSDQYAVAAEKISDLGEQYSVASRKIGDLSEQNSEASKKIKDLSKQRSIDLKKLSVLDKEKKDFEKYAKGVVSELEEDLLSEKQARKKIASMAKNQVMKSLSNQADTELKAYFSKKKVKRLKNQIGDLGEQYSVASRKIGDLSEQNSIALRQIGNLSEKYSLEAKKVNDLSEQHSSDEKNIATLSLEKKNIENQAKEAVSQANIVLLEAKIESNALKKEIEDLKDKDEKGRISLADIKNEKELIEAIAKKETSMARRGQLQAELSESAASKKAEDFRVLLEDLKSKNDLMSAKFNQQLIDVRLAKDNALLRAKNEVSEAKAALVGSELGVRLMAKESQLLKNKLRESKEKNENIERKFVEEKELHEAAIKQAKIDESNSFRRSFKPQLEKANIDKLNAEIESSLMKKKAECFANQVDSLKQDSQRIEQELIFVKQEHDRKNKEMESSLLEKIRPQLRNAKQGQLEAEIANQNSQQRIHALETKVDDLEKANKSFGLNR